MPQLDIERAKKDGITDSELADYLADKFPNFDIAKARGEGVPDKEIVDYLATKTPPTQIRSEREQYVPPWARESPNAWGALGAGKAVWEQAAKPVVEAGAMQVGAMGGAAVAPPFGAILGGGTGYSIARQATGAIDNEIAKLQGMKTKDLTSLDRAMQAGEDIALGGAMQATGTAIGEGMIGPISKVVAPYADRIQPYMNLMVERAKKFGMRLTPADVLQSKSLGLVESMFEKTITATDLVKDWRLRYQLEPLMEQRNRFIESAGKGENVEVLGQKIKDTVTRFLEDKTILRDKKLLDMRTDILARLGSNESLANLGLEGKELLKARSIASALQTDAAYESVGKAMPKGTMYETPMLTNVARDELSKIEGLPANDPTLMNVLKWAAKEPPQELVDQAALFQHRPEIQQAILQGAKVTHNWDKLEALHRRLNSLIRGENEAVFKAGMAGTRFQGTESGMIYNHLKDALLTDMEAIARSEGGNAWENFQLAKGLYRKQAEIFKSPEVQKMISARPEDFIDAAIKPNGITEIEFARKALGEEGFNKIREGLTNKLMGLDKTEMFGKFDPAYLKTQLKRYGNETLSHVYDVSELYQLNQIAKEGLDLSKQKIGTGLLKTISEKDPATVVDAIIGAEEAKPLSSNLHGNLLRVKQVLPEEQWKSLTAKVAEKIFSFNNETGLVRPITFGKMVTKYGKTLDMMYGKEKADTIRELADVSRQMLLAEKIAGNPSGTGQTIITYSYIGMFAKDLVKGTVMAITPRQMANMYFSDSGLKWLLNASRMPAEQTSKDALALSAKLVGVMAANREVE